MAVLLIWMSFSKRVWALCAQVPKGRVTTYRDIASKLGSRAYRAVGNALNANPGGFVDGGKTVPCHRVVCSNGALGGFAHGAVAKEKLLEREGVRVNGGKIVDFGRVRYRF